MAERENAHVGRADDTTIPGETKRSSSGSRAGKAWMAVVALAVLLLVLVVFIAQNTQSIEVSFLGWSWRAPLAVSLLVAALVGILLTIAAGSLRILQLRQQVRRSRRGSGSVTREG